MKTRVVQFLCVAAIATMSYAEVPPPHRYTRREWGQIRAKLLVAPTPEYPGFLQRANYTGAGLFRIYFNTRGEVSGIRILKTTGHKELDIEVLKALGRWRAQPGPKWELDEPVTFRKGGKWPYSPIDKW